MAGIAFALPDGMIDSIACQAVASPRRSFAWVWPGIIMMIAGLVVAAWPSAASDCHGSPVCGLDALAELAKLLVGGALAVAGMLALAIGGIVSAARR